MKAFNRGNIYYADLDPCIGSEQGGIRPVLVIQNDVGNRNSPTTIIAPLTDASNNKSLLPTHIELNARDGMKYDSTILIEQTRVIDKRRLTNYIGCLSKEEMKIIDRAIIDEFGVSIN